MSEIEIIQAYLDKKYEGGYIVFSKDAFKKEGKYLLNEMKALALSKNPSERAMHIYRVAAARAILLRTRILTEEDISTLSRKASVTLSDNEKSREKVIVACQEYLTACGASPDVLLEELKVELREE